MMQGMVIDMNEERLQTVAQLQAFLEGTISVDFAVVDAQRYDFIARTVRRFGYSRLKRPDKTVVLRFLERVSGYSRQQRANMCRVLDVSESGYHAWRQRPPSPRAQDNARLEVEIKAAQQRTRQTYGPERLQADLSENGIQVGIHRIKRSRASVRRFHERVGATLRNSSRFNLKRLR